MKQISNKTLTFLLLAAIVISITGTILNINRVNQLIPQMTLITGMASSTGTGMVNVSVAGTTSITALDSQINFGSCSPATDVGCNVTSNASAAQCSCTSGNWPDNITIKNDGNRNINVTVQASVLASTFIGGSTPSGAEMWFSVRNSSNTPGCFNSSAATVPSGFDGTTGMQWNWQNFSAANTGYLACQNLTYGINTNSMYISAKLVIPANAPAGAGKNTTLTFTATNW